jgi:hypothetical protein
MSIYRPSKTSGGFHSLTFEAPSMESLSNNLRSPTILRLLHDDVIDISIRAQLYSYLLQYSLPYS